MKRKIYITAFIILGILVSFMLHAGVEIFYIKLLIRDFAAYGLGLSWDHWVTIHDVGSIILLIVGIMLGYRQGKVWWHRNYGYTHRASDGIFPDFHR